MQRLLIIYEKVHGFFSNRSPWLRIWVQILFSYVAFVFEIKDRIWLSIKIQNFLRRRMGPVLTKFEKIFACLCFKILLQCRRNWVQIVIYIFTLFFKIKDRVCWLIKVIIVNNSDIVIVFVVCFSVTFFLFFIIGIKGDIVYGLIICIQVWIAFLFFLI